MTKIGLAGDWHGNDAWASYVIQTFGELGVRRVFQLGDFGLGWPGDGWGQMRTRVRGACRKADVTLEIVPGNHENWAWINSKMGDLPYQVTDRVTMLPRGYRWEIDGRTFVALGGAPSIDFLWRVEGRSWWREEMITLEEAEAVAAAGHADVMLTHDAPRNSTDEVNRIIATPPELSGWPERALAYAREGHLLMETAFAGVQPKVFAHGHFHVTGEKQVGDTKFLSLGMDGQQGNALILDLDTLDHEWIDL